MADAERRYYQGEKMDVIGEHGTDWAHDARGDRIEVGDAVLYPSAFSPELACGYVVSIFLNGSVEIGGLDSNRRRWASDVVLHVSREQRAAYGHLMFR